MAAIGLCFPFSGDISVVYVTTSVIGLSAAQQGSFVVVFPELNNAQRDILIECTFNIETCPQ